MTINVPALLPDVEEFKMFQTIAKHAVTSGLYSNVGSESKIFMVLMAARELGVSPMLALNGGIWNIQGKIEISARLMNGLIRRAGHSITIVESSNKVCILRGKRNDGDTFECSFSIDEAAQAGLASRDVWKKYTSDMLYNRCMSRLARRLFPDVIGTCYIEGEVKEAKDVESLQMAQVEEIVPSPIQSESIPCQKKDDVKISQESPDVINSDQLKEFMELGEKIDEKCSENMLKYLFDEYNITQDTLSKMPEKAFIACRKGMLNNIKMNQTKVVNNAEA